MDKALYIAMTGAKNNMLAQVNHSNNLANIGTTGFKADFAQARSMPIYNGEGLPTRAFALTESPSTDFVQGPLVETGRDLDIAIENQGFIAVQTPDGGEAFTRAGSLYVDSVGILRTGNDLPVLGNGGPVNLPPSETIEVAIDGTITVVAVGDSAEAPVQVDRLRLVNPDTSQIYKFSDGLFRMRDPNQAADADAAVRLVSGFIEGSNVNAVNELTSVLSLSRQYEMQVKLMQTVKENSESSARLLQQG